MRTGPGAAGGGDVERLGDDAGQVLRAHDELVVLGDRAGDADRVALLERIRADGAGGDLAGDDDHGDRVHVGVAQRGDHVGGGRTARHHRHAGTAGDVGVALGHVARTLLVAHEDVADGALQKRVVGGEDAAAGEAEHDLGPGHLQALDECLCSGELHGSDSLFFGAAVVRWCGGVRWCGRFGSENKKTSALGGGRGARGYVRRALHEYYENAGGRRHSGRTMTANGRSVKPRSSQASIKSSLDRSSPDSTATNSPAYDSSFNA